MDDVTPNAIPWVVIAGRRQTRRTSSSEPASRFEEYRNRKLVELSKRERQLAEARAAAVLASYDSVVHPGARAAKLPALERGRRVPTPQDLRRMMMSEQQEPLLRAQRARAKELTKALEVLKLGANSAAVAEVGKSGSSADSHRELAQQLDAFLALAALLALGLLIAVGASYSGAGLTQRTRSWWEQLEGIHVPLPFTAHPDHPQAANSSWAWELAWPWSQPGSPDAAQRNATEEGTWPLRWHRPSSPPPQLSAPPLSSPRLQPPPPQLPLPPPPYPPPPFPLTPSPPPPPLPALPALHPFNHPPPLRSPQTASYRSSAKAAQSLRSHPPPPLVLSGARWPPSPPPPSGLMPSPPPLRGPMPSPPPPIPKQPLAKSATAVAAHAHRGSDATSTLDHLRFFDAATIADLQAWLRGGDRSSESAIASAILSGLLLLVAIAALCAAVRRCSLRGPTLPIHPPMGNASGGVDRAMRDSTDGHDTHGLEIWPANLKPSLMSNGHGRIGACGVPADTTAYPGRGSVAQAASTDIAPRVSCPWLRCCE